MLDREAAGRDASPLMATAQRIAAAATFWVIRWAS